jgi:hypothetical protein
MQKKKSKFQIRSEASKKRWQRDDTKENYWREQLSALAVSKLSVRGYCQVNNISESSFRAWRRELALRDREMPLASARNTNESKNPFVPIRLVGDEPNQLAPTHQNEKHSQLELVVRGGAVIRIECDTDLTLVSKLLSALEDKNA